MAILNGTEIKVYSSGTTNLVAFAQNCTLNVNHSPREITNKESAGFKEILEGLRDFSIDIDGAYAWTDAGGSALTNGADDLLASNYLGANRTAVSFIFGDTSTNDVMISCYSETYSQASDLAQKVRIAMDRINQGDYGGETIQSSQFQSYNDIFDDTSGDSGIYRKALDFEIRQINPTN